MQHDCLEIITQHTQIASEMPQWSGRRFFVTYLSSEHCLPETPPALYQRRNFGVVQVYLTVNLFLTAMMNE